MCVCGCVCVCVCVYFGVSVVIVGVIHSMTVHVSCVGIDEDDKYVYAGTQTSDVAIYNVST